MKYRSIVLLTCVYTLSPTGSPAASPKGWAGTKHSASSSSVHNTKHSLATIPEAPAFATEDFPALTGRPIPTKPAKARAVAQPMAKGEPVVTSGNARAVSSVIDPSSVDKESLDAAAQKSTPQEIQILNDATGRVCDLDYEECVRKLNEIACQIRRTYLFCPSESAQAFDNRAQNFKSLAHEYSLIITLGTNYGDRQDTQHKFTRALGAAATELYNAAGSYSLLGKRIEEAARFTESAEVYQSCAKVCRELGQSRVEVGALKGAASALYYAASALSSAADSHTRAGNHGDAAACHIESAEVYQSCAKVYHELEESEEEADALKGAAGALRNVAILHANAGKDADAAQAYKNSAALYQEVAKIYGESGYRESQADALKGAADALRNAAIIHTDADNHAAAVATYENSVALLQEVAKIYGELEDKRRRQARTLHSAAFLLHCVALSHTNAGNHAAAVATYEKSVALYQEVAKIHGALKDRTSDRINEAGALQSAAFLLHCVALSYTKVLNHQGAAQAREKRDALQKEAAELYGAFGTREGKERAARKVVQPKLYCLELSRTDIDNQEDAVVIYENIATLYQKRSKILGESGHRERHALKGAADALRSAAILHANAGNRAKSADLYLSSAKVYHGLEEYIEEADALKGAESALYYAALSHTNADNHADAAKAHEKLAALYQETAEIYGALGGRESQADGLKSAADALRNAAISHARAGNHADAAKAHEKRNALYQ